MKVKWNLTYILLILASLVVFSCKEDDDAAEPCDTSSEVNLTIRLQYNGEDVEFFKDYTNTQNNTFSFSTFKLYLSDIQLIDEDDNVTEVSEIALFDFDNSIPANMKNTLSFEADWGNYKAVNFGLGVKSSLNDEDPATYDLDHPLSLNNLMYWSWSTQYKFVMAEGNVETNSWLVHPGTNDLYIADISVVKDMMVDKDNPNMELIINFNKVLDGATTIDLLNNGVSHTTDNLQLARDFSENLSNAFE